ncbi:MAG: hypothetical protein LBE91_19475 [Tannerella sp.]|jgi:TRAP-type uncharacterized transport system fused permease subunit|nr:hypothetical protein [Tannerella sp.]
MRNYFFILAGSLLLIGAITYLTRWYYAPYFYAFGAAGVALSFMTSPYQGLDLRGRRLHRINIIASVLIIVSSYFMFRDHTGWVVFLLIAALLILYTSFIRR